MGWCSGSELAIEIYDEVRKHLPKNKRQEVAKFIYERFRDEDADEWYGDSKLEKDAGVNQEEEE